MNAYARLVLLTAAVYLAFKALTIRRLSPARAVGYWLLWPGMDPAPFAERRTSDGLPLAAWGLAKMAAGAALLSVRAGTPWIDVPRALAGIGLLVHFGLCDVLAGLWRRAGVPVERLFVNPAAARTLGEFWGRRWNLAFHVVVRERIFRPVARRWGPAAGVGATFLASGLIHDLLLSVPAGGGWGLPTVYFALQGALVLAERRWGAGGRVWTLGWVLGTSPLLFHPWFIDALIRPWAA